MTATLFLEAFGQLPRDANLAGIISGEDDFHSVFDAPAELMGWSIRSKAMK